MAKSEVIARGLVVTGNPAVVYHNTDDDGNESYSLDIIPAVTPVGAGSSGFSSLDDLKRYLSSHDEEEFESTDAKGKKSSVTRQGLGTATALFSFPADTTSQSSPAKSADSTQKVSDSDPKASTTHQESDASGIHTSTAGDKEPEGV